MGRNYLTGRDGDRINAVLAAAGYNFSLLLRWFAKLLRALANGWSYYGLSKSIRRVAMPRPRPRPRLSWQRPGSGIANCCRSQIFRNERFICGPGTSYLSLMSTRVSPVWQQVKDMLVTAAETRKGHDVETATALLERALQDRRLVPTRNSSGHVI